MMRVPDHRRSRPRACRVPALEGLLVLVGAMARITFSDVEGAFSAARFVLALV